MIVLDVGFYPSRFRLDSLSGMYSSTKFQWASTKTATSLTLGILHRSQSSTNLILLIDSYLCDSYILPVDYPQTLMLCNKNKNILFQKTNM